MTTTEGIRQWLDRGGVTDRLAGLDRPEVADLGCGAGWSTIELGEQLPRAAIVGLDVDLAAVAEARANVARARRGAQIAIRCGDAAHLDGGPYDLVTILRVLSDPAAVLAAAKACLAPGGEVVLVGGAAAVARVAGFDHVELTANGGPRVHLLG
jgi:16S rRNA G1207 methylase RsmC